MRKNNTSEICRIAKFLNEPIILAIMLFSLSICSCKMKTGNDTEAFFPAGPYTADWESLKKHNEEPEWIKDAKFGIYFHWGVYSVPAAFNEWYPRSMHFPGRVFEHHVKTYGHPSEFGYHDFVPMFKAAYFNADEWAELFHKAGAKFAGPVAEHHDGFSMWDSDITPWNAMDKGPHKDITGLMAKALKERNMKLITTFHHAKQLQRYQDSVGEQRFEFSHYPYFEGMPPHSEDPDLQLLYGNIQPEKWHEHIWLGKLKEVIDKYKPDIIWFDYVFDKIPEAYQKAFCAYYLNKAREWQKEVVIVTKNDLSFDIALDDHEKTRKNRIGEKVWMTDQTISKGSWCYTEDLQIRGARELVHELIDIVSKNGVMLLNVSPMANGIIPDNQKETLIGIGKWLDVHGEAIYGTRPWYTFGEGPTKEPEGTSLNLYNDFLNLEYSARDIRYTTRGDTIFAILLGIPEPEYPIKLTAFGSKEFRAHVKNICLVGSDEAVTWEMNENGLFIAPPETVKNNIALVYRIETL